MRIPILTAVLQGAVDFYVDFKTAYLTATQGRAAALAWAGLPVPVVPVYGSAVNAA